MTRDVGKHSDIKKSGDRGPREFKTHVVDSEGDLMMVASGNVIATHPMNTIKNVAELMVDNDVRRVPVLDAGTDRLIGLAAAIDIMDFLAGGEKYNIMLKDYNGNFLAAVNCPISKIMVGASYLGKKASIDDAVNIMIDKRTSCIPIVEDSDSMKVVALVTERDVMPVVDDIGVAVGDVMTSKPLTSSLGMMVSDVSKIMVRNRIRRLPVIREDHLIGVVTVFDILRMLAEGDFKGAGAEENLSTRVDEIMEKEVVTVKPEDDLSEVGRLVKETGIGGFPVAEDGVLKGIVTTTDVLRWVYRESG
ncbi:MAG: CBS domain-containing protein [Candidatus Altiarchaeota archaeon]